MIERCEDVNSLKEKGNDSLKDQKYEEAVFYYTRALKIDGENHSLYSNRSLAFLKMHQYYFAFEDAKEAIKLQPDWAKGYFRKGEVEFSTLNYNEALLSYSHALMLHQNDTTIERAIRKTMDAVKKDEACDAQVAWAGAALGIFIGALIIIADQAFTVKPALSNPLLMALITVIIALLGFASGKAVRFYIKSQRISLLDPPIELLREQEANEELYREEIKAARARYSRAQARQRYRRGRL